MSSLFAKIIIKENAHKILKKNVPCLTKKINICDKNVPVCGMEPTIKKRVDWTTSKEKRLGFKKSWV